MSSFSHSACVDLGAGSDRLGKFRRITREREIVGNSRKLRNRNVEKIWEVLRLFFDCVWIVKRFLCFCFVFLWNLFWIFVFDLYGFRARLFFRQSLKISCAKQRSIVQLQGDTNLFPNISFLSQNLDELKNWKKFQGFLSLQGNFIRGVAIINFSFTFSQSRLFDIK